MPGKYPSASTYGYRTCSGSNEHENAVDRMFEEDPESTQGFSNPVQIDSTLQANRDEAEIELAPADDNSYNSTDDRKTLTEECQSLKVESSSEPEFSTRWLYFAMFCWNACQGRFMSLYFLAEGLDESQIGAVFAVGSLTAPIITTFVALAADRYSTQSKNGRQRFYAWSIVVGTIAFSLQAVHFPYVSRFTSLLVLQVFARGANTSVGTLADAITVAGLVDRKNWGNQRLYGAVSWAIVHLALGCLLEWYGRIVQHVLILMFAVMNIVVLVNLGSPAPSSETGKKNSGLSALADNKALFALLQSYGSSHFVIAFFLLMITLGCGMTIVENLIFLYFKELNASFFMMGVSVVVTVVFEIPLFSYGPKLLSVVGAKKLLVVAGLCYSFRVVGYTLCPSGWYVLLFEPMHGITIAASSQASVETMASITPQEFSATGQALLTLARSGLGSSTGNYVGGVVIERFGEAACYRGAACVVTFGIFIFMMAWCYSPEHTGMERLGDADEPVLKVIENPDEPKEPVPKGHLETKPALYPNLLGNGIRQ